MMNLDVNHFKSKLGDYNYLESKIRRIKEMQLVLDTKRGIGAVRYDKESTQGSIDPLTAELNKLDDVEKADYLDHELRSYEAKMSEINDFLEYSSVGESIKAIHCTGNSTYYKEADRLHIGEKTLKRLVNKEIIRYLTK